VETVRVGDGRGDRATSSMTVLSKKPKRKGRKQGRFEKPAGARKARLVQIRSP